MIDAMVTTAKAVKSGDDEAIEAAQEAEAKIVRMSGYLSRRVDRRNAYRAPFRNMTSDSEHEGERRIIRRGDVQTRSAPWREGDAQLRLAARPSQRENQ